MKKRICIHGLPLILGLVSSMLLLGQETDTDRQPGLTADSLFAPDRLIDVKIEIAEKDWDLLRQQSRSMIQALGEDLPEKPFTYVPADIRINGQWIEQVGIRKKGFLGSLSEDRPSLKIKFSEYRKQDPIEGLSRLTLNNNQQDPSCLSQFLSYQLFNDVGLIAPRCNFAQVTVNGEYLGIYSNVESVKKPFLNRFGDHRGSLYEGTVTDFFPDKIRRFEAKNSAADFKDLEELARILEETPTDLEALERVVDVDAFLKFWALESLIGFWDGYTNNQNNYFVYRNPSNQKLYFIPWGLDSCFTNEMPIPPFNIPHPSVHSQAILANQLYRIPEVQARYHATLQSIMKEQWNEERLLERMENAKNLIGDHVLESQGDFEKELKRVENFIRSRRQDLSKEMSDWPVKLNTPPRRPFSFAAIGDVQATFDTSWFEKTPATNSPVGKTDITLTMNGELVQLTELSVYAEPDQNRPEEDGQRPPALVFKGKRQRDGKAILIGVGVKNGDFQPSKQKHIGVEGILIEGNPLLFFAKMAMGKSQFTLVSGKVQFENASREAGSRVNGSIQLSILRTSEDKAP